MAASSDDIVHLRNLLEAAYTLVSEQIEKDEPVVERGSEWLELLATNLSSFIEAIDQNNAWIIDGIGKGAGFGATRAMDDWGWGSKGPIGQAVRDAEEFFRTGALSSE